MSMHESSPDTSAPEGETPGVATAVPTRTKWRKRSIFFVSAAGALVVACGATGIAATARIVSLETQASASSSQSSTATLLPQAGGSSTYGSGSGTSRASVTTSATAATDAQSVGVVLIDTVLKYEGAEAAGTGIILTSDGEILTNNHVVDGATTITVTIASTGKTYTADVVGTDATNDIAVLQLQGASGLKTAKTDTSEVAVADAVTAVGNAGGTGSLSQASGTVTAIDQTITAAGETGSDSETLTGLIETDADVVSGDSGGPLYDADGEVVGIDTAASSGSAQTTGYAIPIATALGIAKQIETGVETADITIGYPAFLGVEVQQATTGASQNGTATTATSGATIAGVLDGTPAATAGLVAGDTITAVDGVSVASGAALTSLLGSHDPGDSVTLSYTDAAGAAHSVSVVLIQGAAN
jgi:S1-C subfamily serine protease